MAATGEQRSEQLAQGLAGLRRRIDAACVAAGRSPEEVTFVAVSKGFPAADVTALAQLGVTDFGESRDQDAAPKAAAVPGVRWHFVGRLQRNKCRSVARYADVVHSVDSAGLVDALDAAAARAGRSVDALLQLSVDGDPRRGGVPEQDLLGLAERLEEAPSLRLSGVMAVAPQQMDVDEAFASLQRVSERLRARFPVATTVSAGMSGDLEAAVRHGATCVRVGTSLFGARTPPIG